MLSQRPLTAHLLTNKDLHMGWGRTLFFGDGDDCECVDDVERHIASLRKRQQLQTHVDRSQDDELRALHRENGELKLHLSALARLLVAKGLISREDLERLADAIDASDGQRDGQFTGDLAGNWK
jgi:hypothetical protein